MHKSVGVFVSLMLLLFMISRLFTVSSRQISERDTQEIRGESETAVNAAILENQDAFADRLAGAIRFKTVSYDDDQKDLTDFKEFEKLHKYLQKCFPLVHKNLKRTVINKHSLIYHWVGSDASQKPYLLYAHMDVVPADDEQHWKVPPFDGIVKDGFIWGRGAIDDKHNLLGMLEALELLIKEGFRPKRR